MYFIIALIGVYDDMGEVIAQGVLSLGKAVDDGSAEIPLSCRLSCAGARRGELNCMAALEIATRTESRDTDADASIVVETKSPLIAEEKEH